VPRADGGAAYLGGRGLGQREARLMVRRAGWLNRTTVGVSLASLFSDISHELATAVLPAFLLAMGAGPAVLGWIEGGADGLSATGTRQKLSRPRSFELIGQPLLFHLPSPRMLYRIST